MEGSHREPKKHKNRGIYSPVKISQPKEASLAKTFRSQKRHPVKMGLCCEKRVPLWNNFAATRPPPVKNFVVAKPPLGGTRVPFHNPKAHLAAAKWAVKLSKEKFRNHKPTYEKSYETTWEILLLLWNPHLSGKWPSSCENSNRLLNTYLSL